MRIFLTGLVSVHWGRVEYGNIGNYYIVETTVRELHRVFPEAEIVTTFQMTEQFCKNERVTVLPLDLYYSWSDTDLAGAYRDHSIAAVYSETARLIESTPFIKEVLNCDIICDFSGEMWGDHAEPVGEKRFLVHLLKMRTAQLLGKKTVLLAGSQGPFNVVAELLPLAKTVFKDYALVANREAASRDLLEANGFNISRLKSFTDPAFLFEPSDAGDVQEIIESERIIVPEKKTVGFIVCGFNMLEGPYDKEPRRDDEFIQFAELVEFLVEQLDLRVFLMSHQNGFVKDPDLKLIHGRDYPYAKRLTDLVVRRGKVGNDAVRCTERPLTPKQTKAVIGTFDMFISGRIHAFVAAVSQCVPTVIITRGFGGRSHRNIGFARSVGLEEYISDPASAKDMIDKSRRCWERRIEIRRTLEETIPTAKLTAHAMFDSLKGIA